jgi:iron complex outermembrane recepter protein
MYKTLLLIGMFFSCVLCVGAADAQTAKKSKEQTDSAELGTIVVTANRREQNIEDVGVVVSQFSGDDLRAAGATDTKDLAQLVPGVYVAGAYGGQSQQFNIRGVVQSDYLDTIENPVAFYIDDVYITSAQGQTMSFFDIGRVEILKGPQGTLFGRNATGGLVHTVIAKPELGKVDGYADLSYARFNEFNGQGAINLPIGSSAALRASVQYSRIDNFWKNKYPSGGSGSNSILSFDGPGGNSVGAGVTPNGQDLGGDDTIAGRLQFLIQPSDALSIRLTGSYAKSNMSISPYTQDATIAVVDAQGRVIGEERVGPTETRLAIGPGGANYAGPTVLVPWANGFFQPDVRRTAPGGNFWGYVPLDPKSRTLSEDFALRDLDHVKSQVYAAHVDYDFGGAVLSSVTSYQKYNKEVYLGDGSPVNVLGFGAASDTRAWSQEIRLNGKTDRTRWQVGAFYLDNKVDLLQGILEPSGSALANLGTIFTGNPFLVEFGGDLVTDVAFRSKSSSVFGQVEFDFADRWTVIAGARYINEKQTDRYRHYTALNLNNYQVEGGFLLPAFQPDYDNSRSDGLWTGKLQLEHRPNDNLLLYAGLNRGVKAGNYNAPFTFSPADAIPAADMSYSPETLLSFETGFKFSRGPGLLNASAFYYDYKDFQAFVFTTASGIVRNVDSKVYGIDVEAGYQVTDALHLGATLAYSHAAIKDFEIAPGIFRTVRPPYSPREQASAVVDYRVPADIWGGKLSFSANVSYAGKIYHNIRNFDAQEFAGRTLVNLSATWKSDRSGLYLSVFGKNIFDERYGQIGFDNTVIFGGQNVSYGKPSSYGASVGYKF